MRTIKIKYKKKRQNTTKIRRNIMRRIQSIEQKTKTQQDNNKEKDTKETKIKWMQKEEKSEKRTTKSSY